ncbi:MAG: YggT family protein [Gammaproteobacteria bacterium]
MNNPYLSSASVYLISAISDLFLILVLLRFLLQLARADFYNPLCQFIVKVTNPALKPLRRVIPGWKGIDMSSLVLLLAVQALALLLVNLATGREIAVGALLVLSVGELLSLTLNCYLITILAQVILSWVGPGGHHPVSALLYNLNEPVMRPARRLLPPISGIDLSPIVVLFAIQLLKILVVAPIIDVGRGLG